MDLIWLLLSGSIGGFAVAWVAKLLLPGDQRVSFPVLILIGTGAGFIGGLISGLIGLEDEDGWKQYLPFAISVGLAALAIFLWTNFKSKKKEQMLAPVRGSDGAGARGVPGQGGAAVPGGAAAGKRPTGAGPDMPKADLGTAAKGPSVRPTKKAGESLDPPVDGPGI